MKINKDTSFLLSLMQNYISASQPTIKLTDSAISRCTQYGLGPLLAHIYLVNDNLTTEAQRVKLNSIELTSKFYTASQKKALNEILARTTTPYIRIILLKGIHLAGSYYASPHLRQMGDIDILVDKIQTNNITRILISMGYIQKSHNSDDFYKTHHHLMPFYHTQTGVCIEVHTHLFFESKPLGARALFQLDHIHQNLTLLKKEMPQQYVLTPELNLHYTITHWLREFRIETSFIQLIDICLLMKHKPFSWEKFIALIKTRDQATEIKLTLGFLFRNNIISLPDNIVNEIISQKDSMGLLGKRLLQTILDGYINQDKFITQVLGSANCARILRSYFRNEKSWLNHLHALKTLILPSDKDSLPPIVSIRDRITNLIKRGIGNYDKN